MRPAPATMQQVPLNRQTWRRFVRVVGNLASSEVGGKAKLLFAGLLVLLLAINGLNVVNSYVGRDFMTAIAERSRAGFVSLAVLYLIVFAASTCVAVIYRFFEERLGLLWREWLTGRLLQFYLHPPNAYRLADRLAANGEIANPDQRIADDVRAFTTTTLSFVLLILSGTFTAVAFSGVMWSISPLLFVVGVVYAAAGSILTILFGHPLVGLNYAQLDKEAAFRAELVQLRDTADRMSVLRYESQLLARLQHRLDDLIGNARRMITVNRNLGFFTTGYNYLIQIIPALIVAPLFIRGEVEFGVITQSAMAFSQLLGAFSLIITQFQSISSFAAVIARLGSLGEALEQASAVTILSQETCGHQRKTVDCPICLAHRTQLAGLPTIVTREENGRVAFEHLTLRAIHDDALLLNDLSLTIPLGTRVLILGDNEAAKIALFRAAAGLWEIGAGRVIRPGGARIAFLPERPYLPPGTLREVLAPFGSSDGVPDEKVRPVIEALNLGAVVARVGGMDSECDWNDVLSLGDQLLLAFVRILLGAPEFAFLDRPQTILTSAQLGQVLAMMDAAGITYITIGERNGWHGRYDAELMVNPDGSWTWTPTGVPEDARERA